MLQGLFSGSAFGGKTSHRGHGGHRGGLGLGTKTLGGHLGLACENDGPRGEHRTEVTEGDSGWGRKRLGDTLDFRARMSGLRESIARRSRRPRRGTPVGDENAWGTPWISVRECRASGRASHGGHGGHGGGLRLGTKTLGGHLGFPCENVGPRGEHRTEVTEGDWGCGRWAGCVSSPIVLVIVLAIAFSVRLLGSLAPWLLTGAVRVAVKLVG
jgi:hypothetical protein